MSKRTRWAVVLGLPAMLGASLALAQEAVGERQEIRQERRQGIREGLRNAADRAGEVASEVAGAIRGTDGNQINDQTIASILIPANQEEVALGQFAQERTQNPQVKEFAQQLVQDHTQFVNQLRQFGGVTAGPAGPATDGASNQSADPNRRPTEAAPRNDGARIEANPQGAAVQAGETQVNVPADPAAPRDAASGRSPQTQSRLADAGQARGYDMAVMQLHRQIGERCLAMTQQMLGKKQGAEFDKAFVGLNIPAHVRMLATLETVQDHASPELQQILQKGQQATQQHLAHAEQLMRQLDQGGASDQPAGNSENRPRGNRPSNQ